MFKFENVDKKELAKEIVIVLLLFVSLVIAFWASKSVLHNKWDFLPWISSASLIPQLVSTMFAIGIFCGLFLRFNKEMFNTIPKVIICIFDILFLSSFTCVFVSDKFGFAFLIGGLAFSWIGMRSIAGFSWIILIICSIPRLLSVSRDMGFFGAIYILCPFISFAGQVFWLDMIKFDFKELKNEFFGMQSQIQSDVNSSVEISKKVGGKVIDIAKSAMPGGNIINTVAGDNNKEIETKQESKNDKENN